ncbi:hypothetical protein JTE90_004995 [Oedothorax gibbosus]|uniref:C2H2-type domain-containing protein n=1 Tax=Oedothorax gibbosus TaxID=931172 RepID=A0AAV6VAB8_9ARAC|nr:hypothetical protein JTE90_004995 [Oedothorax gibbosus]
MIFIFSDEYEEEELTCNFCDRSFRSVKRLERHQTRLRHYACSVCDAPFQALSALEAHKEALDHFSDYELRALRHFASTQQDGPDEQDEDLDDDEEDGKPEERRMLL